MCVEGSGGDRQNGSPANRVLLHHSYDTTWRCPLESRKSYAHP